jgi:hypothetical protein
LSSAISHRPDTAVAPTYPAKVSIRIVRAMLGMIEQPENISPGVTLEETMPSTMYPLSNHQLKCDARDTAGSTIFFFGGVGVRYPSSVGRVSGFSDFAFSVSDIVSSPAPQWQRGVVMPRFRRVGKQKGPLTRP